MVKFNRNILSNLNLKYIIFSKINPLSRILTYLDSKKTAPVNKVGDKSGGDDYILHDVDQKHLYAMAN